MLLLWLMKTHQEVEQPTDSCRETTDSGPKLYRCDLASVQERNSYETQGIDDVIQVSVDLVRSLAYRRLQRTTYKKNTAAFKAEGLFDDTSPVTQARHTDMPTALEIISSLLPNRSTVKEHIMPPRIMQA